MSSVNYDKVAKLIMEDLIHEVLEDIRSIGLPI